MTSVQAVRERDIFSRYSSVSEQKEFSQYLDCQFRKWRKKKRAERNRQGYQFRKYAERLKDRSSKNATSVNCDERNNNTTRTLANDNTDGSVQEIMKLKLELERTKEKLEQEIGRRIALQMKNEKLNDEQRIAIDIDNFLIESDDEKDSDCVNDEEPDTRDSTKESNADIEDLIEEDRDVDDKEDEEYFPEEDRDGDDREDEEDREDERNDEELKTPTSNQKKGIETSNDIDLPKLKQYALTHLKEKSTTQLGRC